MVTSRRKYFSGAYSRPYIRELRPALTIYKVESPASLSDSLMRSRSQSRVRIQSRIRFAPVIARVLL